MSANFAKVFKNGTAAVKKKKKKKKKLKEEKNHASLCWKFYLFGGAAAALSSNCIRIYHQIDGWIKLPPLLLPF
jgi:hypothetical protein